jgi:hypothetical protein
VDDPKKAAEILEYKVKTSNFVTTDHTILLYDHFNDAGEISRLLVENCIRVDSIAPVEQSLEGYFLDLMKGKLSD